jgi:hypothetical protein
MARERYVRHGAGERPRAGGDPARATARATSFARVAAAACAVLLGAAAAAAPTDLALVEATAPCCADPSRFGWQALPSEGSVDFAIDRKSPLFEFQSGKSFFHAFRLPSSGRPYTLELRSFLEDAESPRSARVFFPVLAVLTDDFLVSRATDLDALRFDLPMLEQTIAPAYRVQLPIDPANTRERYLVVFTPTQLLAARGVQVTTPESAAQAARSAFLGASAFGRFRVTLVPSADAAAGSSESGAAAPASPSATPEAAPTAPPAIPPAATPSAPPAGGT